MASCDRSSGDNFAISNLFIIGAGFTKAVFPAAPLNDDLLTQVVGSKPDNSALGRVWQHYGGSNIESLLTRLDLDLLEGGSPFTKGDRDDVSKQVAQFVSQFRFTSDVEWLRPLTQILSDNDVIISLNYDCFLEGFLDFHNLWSPKDGYDVIEGKIWGDSLPDNNHNIRILKLHGSESFRRSEFHNKPGSFTVGLKIDSTMFPRSGLNKNFGYKSDAGPYVICPSFTKQLSVELHSLFLNAIRFANVAQNLIIIGCGLRPEDGHLWSILTSFMKNQSWKTKRTFILNWHQSANTAARLKDFWGVSIFDSDNLVPFKSDFRSELAQLRATTNKT